MRIFVLAVGMLSPLAVELARPSAGFAQGSLQGMKQVTKQSAPLCWDEPQTQSHVCLDPLAGTFSIYLTSGSYIDCNCTTGCKYKLSSEAQLKTMKRGFFNYCGKALEP